VNRISRREFVTRAAALGAVAAWATTSFSRSTVAARERRDLYPEGVASGDPDSHSVILWTRYASSDSSEQGGGEARLLVEVSEDQVFTRVVAHPHVRVLAAADWTCRVLVGNLRASHVYWYRFTDVQGNSSRIGRTRTAPSDGDPRPVRFAVVSCQNANLGEQHAYRRMIFEDERAAEEERLGFVLHLGDFLYEIVWYPEDPRKACTVVASATSFAILKVKRSATITSGNARRLSRHLSRLSP
jgi:alkaline phosphatase D